MTSKRCTSCKQKHSYFISSNVSQPHKLHVKCWRRIEQKFQGRSTSLGTLAVKHFCHGKIKCISKLYHFQKSPDLQITNHSAYCQLEMNSLWHLVSSVKSLHLTFSSQSFQRSQIHFFPTHQINTRVSHDSLHISIHAPQIDM